jgi:hypothetical protein
MRLSVSAALTLLLGAPSLLAQATLSVRQVLPEGELRPASSITITFSRPLAGTLERDCATLPRSSGWSRHGQRGWSGGIPRPCG